MDEETKGIENAESPTVKLVRLAYIKKIGLLWRFLAFEFCYLENEV